MYCCATSMIRKDWTDYGGDHNTQAFTSDTCPVMCNTFEHLVFAQDTYLRIFTWTCKSFGSHREDFCCRKVLQTGWEKRLQHLHNCLSATQWRKVLQTGKRLQGCSQLHQYSPSCLLVPLCNAAESSVTMCSATNYQAIEYSVTSAQKSVKFTL